MTASHGSYICGRLAPLVSTNVMPIKSNKTPRGGETTTTKDRAPKKPRGPYKPRPIIMYPKPLWDDWDDPADFEEALALHIRRHGENVSRLYKALALGDDVVDIRTLYDWRNGVLAPRSATGFRVLAAIERRYRLPEGYFRPKLPHPGRLIASKTLSRLPMAERRRLAWHLPDDFDRLTKAKQEEVLSWVRKVIVAGATDYRRYHINALQQRFAIKFSEGPGALPFAPVVPLEERLADDGRCEFGRLLTTQAAPAPIDAEARDLVLFKTATLTTRGRARNGVWNRETADQKMEHLGLLFGALVASPDSDVRGHGVPMRSLTFALLAFPAVWDWYLAWREGRRGFFTRWESEMLTVIAALTRRETGWLRQSPRLASYLRPIEGLVTASDVQAAHDDWDGVCDVMHRHALIRAREIDRVARVHRDPFEPVLPILEADSPLAEYRKITEEVRRWRPDRRRFPIAAAEATRSFLMLRLGLHLGLRQKNLRQLLFKPKTHSPTPERQLELLKRGELRWSVRDEGWEVLIPAAAFKNAGSTFFRKSPFRLLLPDLGGLYEEIETYITRDRAVLLKGHRDPGSFFVKTMKARSRSAEYDSKPFYEAWRLTIQRHGIFNPYTGRGAIPGLLPHGPHNVRDVLATHVLKQTGSHEQASYAIQDTPETIAEHYGRFLPQDKAALAAQVLNQVWAA